MNHEASDILSDRVGILIKGVRSSWFQVRATEGILLILAGLSFALPVCFALDNLLALPQGLRLALLLLTALAILGLLGLSLKKALSLTPIAATLLLEKKNLS